VLLSKVWTKGTWLIKMNKAKLIKIFDTRGNWNLGVRLCTKDYSPVPKLSPAEVRKQWKKNNPIKVKEYKKRWNENNPQWHKDYVRRWYIDNRNRILKVKKERYQSKRTKEGHNITQYGVKT